MSSNYVTVELRRLVIDRADGLCEYCLIVDERILERQVLIMSGQYPSASALKRINK